MFHGSPLIRRTTGTISAWGYPELVAAIEKTGRKNLIMAGVTIEYASPFAAMQAFEASNALTQGYGSPRPAFVSQSDPKPEYIAPRMASFCDLSQSGERPAVMSDRVCATATASSRRGRPHGMK